MRPVPSVNALAPSERPRGQALNETLVFGSTALAVLFASPLEAGLRLATAESGHAHPGRDCCPLTGLIRPKSARRQPPDNTGGWY